MQQTISVIRTDHIRSNAEYFASLAPTQKLCAVVKADAYGHGAASVAQTLRPTADVFAVALVDEGVRLRHAGTDKDILVLTPPLCEEEVLRGGLEDLIFTVGDARDYALLKKVSLKYGIAVRCHLKIDTGMNRYGFTRDSLLRFLKGTFCEYVGVEGIFSHYCAPEKRDVREKQLALFLKCCENATYAFGPLVRHISATGGTLSGAENHLDMVRIGIGLYGYLPQGFSLPQGTLKPAMRVYAQAVCSRSFPRGYAGYGIMPAPEKLSVLRTGYGDGFFRKGGICNVNNLCMDAALLPVLLKKYAYVCVFSDAERYAAENGTISYEALCRVGSRSEKIYVEG